MASLYKDKKAYKVNIDTLFGQIDRCTSGFAEITDYQKNQSNYSVSFVRPPHLATHGEKVHIQLEKVNDSETMVHIISESLIKEFDCGNNRANTEAVLHNLDKEYQHVSLSVKTQRNKIVTKIVSIVLVISCIFIVKSCVGDNSSGCSHPSCKENGPFPCYGKNNTCPNYTNCYQDLFCDECD